MKRFLSLFLVILIAICVVGCGGSNSSNTPTPTPTPPTPPTPASWSNSGAVSGGNTWGATLESLQYKSDGSSLYLKLNWNPVGANNLIYVLIDDTNLSGGLTNTANNDSSIFTKDYTIGSFTTGWGNLGMTIPADFNVDAVAWGSRKDALLEYANGGFNAISNTTTATTQLSTIGFNQATDGSSQEFTIPYSSIGSGAKSGDTIKVIVLFGLPKKEGGIHTILPYIATDNVGDASHAITEIHSAADCGILK